VIQGARVHCHVIRIGALGGLRSAEPCYCDGFSDAHSEEASFSSI